MFFLLQLYWHSSELIKKWLIYAFIPFVIVTFEDSLYNE